MINKISSTPFKINKELLDFLLNKGIELNLLTDPLVKHPFEDSNPNFSLFMIALVLLVIKFLY